jgi:hypothetical protein
LGSFGSRGLGSFGSGRGNLAYKPMNEDERHALETKYIKVAGDGRFELFKSSKMFDGPVHQRQHGFDPAVTA